MRFEAPGFALIGSTSALERASAIGDDGVLEAAGLDDDTGCGTASAPDASRGSDVSKPIAHSIPAVARTCRARIIWRSRVFLPRALENPPVDAIGRQRRVVKADAGGVGQRIGQRGCNWIDRRLAHRLGAERTERVVRVGEIDLGALEHSGI